MTDWQLIEVEHVEWQPDDSGYHVLVHRPGPFTVRVDVMEDEEPIISFTGNADNVRKTLMRWFAAQAAPWISREHAAYIGAEIARAEYIANYKQS